MGFGARILADSISPSKIRLTTFELTFPRIILAELNTHRMLSRNSASSRAIPVEKMLRMVDDDPYVPSHWGKNQKGMQAEVELTVEEQDIARRQWLLARDSAMAHAKIMLEIGLHKQLTNRLLEPFMWHTAICSATEWQNVFHLRDNSAAHPEIQRIIHAARELYDASTPDDLDMHEWHLPLVIGIELHHVGTGWWEIDGDGIYGNADVDWAKWTKISVARCARVSYLTHDGKRDVAEDLALYDRLVTPGHLSPLEHAARPIRSIQGEPNTRSVYWKDDNWWCGNFRGWMQHRGTIPREDDILGNANKP